MRIINSIISIFLLTTLVCGCTKIKGIVPDNLIPEQLKSKEKVEPPSSTGNKLVDKYITTARQLEVKGEFVKAIEQYQLALTVDSKNQYAIERINELQITCKENAEKHYSEGMALYNKGQYSNAQKEFLNVLRYDPDHARALKMLNRNRLLGQEIEGYLLHKIQKGETVSILAKKYYGDPMKFRYISEFNKMEDATRVNVDQTIKIPVIDKVILFKSPDEQIIRSGENPESELTDVINVKKVITHVVRPGESLSGLSILYYGNTDNLTLLALFNQLYKDSTLKIGDKIQIPEIAGSPFTRKGKDLAETETAGQEIAEPSEEPKAVIQETQRAQESSPAIEDKIAENREKGLKFFEGKKYEDAINIFEKILDQKPDDSVSLEYIADAHYQQGLNHFIKNEYLAARNEFKKSLEYNAQCEKCEEYIKKSEDTYMDEHYKMGLIHFKNEELEKAKKEWDLVYSLDPDYKEVAGNLEKVNLLIKRLESIKQSSLEEDKQ